jgi:hypothetical protein
LVDLIEFIENLETPEKSIVLNIIIMKHRETCMGGSANCPCEDLLREMNTDFEDNPQHKRKWYQFLHNLAKHSRRKFSRSGALLLFQAYIENFKLNKRFNSVASLIEAEFYQPSLLEQFSIYRLRLHIEREMVEDDNRFAEHDGIDILKIANFQLYSKEFRMSMIDTVDNSDEFWSELMKHDPDIEKLLILGNKINENLELVQKDFEAVKRVFPNHAQTLRLYGEFKRGILFERLEGNQLIQQASYTEKSFISNKNVSSVMILVRQETRKQGTEKTLDSS